MKQYGVGVSVIEPAGYATAINSTQATQQSLDKAWDAVPIEIKREFGEDYFRLCAYIQIHWYFVITESVI